nr:TATA element modulatory factor-like [Aegilops tauschii subsp. strangulata]
MRETRTWAAKKAAAAASSSSKRHRTPSPFPPPSDGTPEADFDLGSFSPKRKRRDTETLAQRAARRSKASTGDKPPASTPRTPVLVEINLDNSPRRSPRFSPQHPPSTDQEDIDTVIEEVTKDAEAEAAKIAAGEAAKSAIEEAAKGLAGEPDKGPARESGEAAAEEAAKEPTMEEVANDQPSSPAAPAPGKYLRVGDDLFVRLPGTVSTRAAAEGEVFDGEALATAGLQKLQALHRARQDKVKSKMAAVDKVEADFEERVAQTQEAAKEQAAKDEAARRQQKAQLDTQEEDLVAREHVLAATLHDKDKEIGKIIAQRTQELEQKHKDTLNALARDNAGKVEKLELERDGLKKEILELTEERDTANRTLADSQVAISDKAKLLSEANDSINDLKLKLDCLEGMLSEARACEETLNKALEDERQLKKDDAAAHKDYVASVNLWISRLIDVAERLTAQLAVMGMPNLGTPMRRT